MEEPEVELPLLVSEIYSSVGITFPSCMFLNIMCMNINMCAHMGIHICVYMYVSVSVCVFQ